ncbi:MAG: hypothetical protein VW802_06770 [Rhodospirillaceae bacterium]|jgi:CheY-like chemotaxis protein
MADVDFKKLSILVIEDEAFMRQLIGRVLRDLNITNIVNAENGQDAF